MPGGSRTPGGRVLLDKLLLTGVGLELEEAAIESTGRLSRVKSLSITVENGGRPYRKSF